jgi:hypothetical protein
VLFFLIGAHIVDTKPNLPHSCPRWNSENLITFEFGMARDCTPPPAQASTAIVMTQMRAKSQEPPATTGVVTGIVAQHADSTKQDTSGSEYEQSSDSDDGDSDDVHGNDSDDGKNDSDDGNDADDYGITADAPVAQQDGNESDDWDADHYGSGGPADRYRRRGGYTTLPDGVASSKSFNTHETT